MKLTRKKLRRLIQEMVRQSEPGYHMSYPPDTKRISYTALVLDDISHQALLQYVPDGWKPIAHHMTLITPREHKGVRLPQRFLNQQASVTATGIVGDDKVLAAVIDTSQSLLPMLGPGFPHVTIATNPMTKGKPFMSNQLKPSMAQQIQPLILTGVIQEILQ